MHQNIQWFMQEAGMIVVRVINVACWQLHIDYPKKVPRVGNHYEYQLPNFLVMNESEPEKQPNYGGFHRWIERFEKSPP